MALNETMTDVPAGVATRQWGAAFTALRRLLSDKDDTVQVFEIMRALNGGTNAKNYRRLLETTAGGRIAYDQVELAPLLMDDRGSTASRAAPLVLPIANLCAARIFRRKDWPRSAASVRRVSTMRILTTGSGGASATRTTSGTFSPAIIVTGWAKHVSSPSPTRRRAGLAGP